MKNFSYALLAVILFSCSQSQSQQPEMKLNINLMEPCAKCPDGSEYANLDDAKKMCGDKAASGFRPSTCTGSGSHCPCSVHIG